MKRTPLLTVIVVLSVALTLPVLAKRAETSPSPSASAQPSSTASPSASASKIRAFPFHGMIASVDAKAKTFTINAKKDGSRVFKISDQSTITKSGSPATMKDLVENEEVRGSFWKEADNSLVAKSVRVGPLTEQEKAAEQARKAHRAERRAARAAASASPGASASPTPSTIPKP